ncbi:cold shock domain-containing protein [Novosphingobium sp. RL4]|uniref:cold shock domain-containing protein n=1 Tax=Novosphingobium sp. RL4 TaxID=3109595 RepID=UPI002D76C310|nr:cold shock domain-containing protein [Novosphingobium sp. RL4]WRT91673.1 cold shock domain-containing protein [Novosphingobium sp. RL4]
MRPEDAGGDNFVHISSAHAVGLETLALGDRFTYDIQIARNGKASAVNLVKLA